MQYIEKSQIQQWGHVNTWKTPVAISNYCPHCCGLVIFTCKAQSEDRRNSLVISLSTCPSCRGRVRVFAVHSTARDANRREDFPSVYMYPSASKLYTPVNIVEDIPERIQKAFKSAVDAHNAQNYSAAATCSRRTLEGLVKFLVPEEYRSSSLAKLIKALPDHVNLTKPLQDLTEVVKDGGNLGAHFDMEREPDENLSRQILELIDYLISYLHVLPKKIELLESQISQS